MTALIVTVYTSGAACMACAQTKRHLTKRAIAFTEVSIDDDPNTLAAIRYLGFGAAPVVLAATASGEQAWSGYRPDRIDALSLPMHAARITMVCERCNRPFQANTIRALCEPCARASSPFRGCDACFAVVPLSLAAYAEVMA